MNKCPDCQETAMTQIRKSFLGPALTANCRACGHEITVPFTAMLAVAPFLISIVLGAVLYINSYLLAAMAIIAGFLSMSAIHAYLVPLVSVSPGKAFNSDTGRAAPFGSQIK